jgi:hypothetical protein
VPAKSYLLRNSTEEAVVIVQDNDSIDPDIGDCSCRADVWQSLSRHESHTEKQESGEYNPREAENAIAHISRRMVDPQTFDEIFPDRF